MTLGEVIALLQSVGWPADHISEAVQVTNCESGQDPRAVGPVVNGNTHTGLFQISSVHGHSVTALMDPTYNATVALGLWRRQGWRPWQCARELGWPLDPGAAPGTAGEPADEGLLSDLGGAVVGGAGAAAGIVGGIQDTIGNLTPDGLADLVRDVGFGLVLVAGGTVLVVLAARAFSAPVTDQLRADLAGAAT